MKLYKIYDSNMSNEQLEAATFTRLVSQAAIARQNAEAARNIQLELEAQILALPYVKDSLKYSGTSSFCNGALKIATKINQKWDQKALATIIQSNDFPIMPFEIEYKPSAVKLKVLREEFPQIFRKLEGALTESPAKPYFTFSEV